MTRKRMHGLTLGVLVMLGSATANATVTNIWTGGGADHLASNPNNWSAGAVLETHHILLDSDTKDLTWDANAVHTVASWNQTENYAGKVTIMTVYDAQAAGYGNFTKFMIGGDCVISNGIVTHASNSTAEIYRLQIEIGGDLTVGVDGEINAQARSRRAPLAAHNEAGPARSIASMPVSAAAAAWSGWTIKIWRTGSMKTVRKFRRRRPVIRRASIAT